MKFFFNLFLRFNTLKQLKFKVEKIIGIQKPTGKVTKQQGSFDNGISTQHIFQILKYIFLENVFLKQFKYDLTPLCLGRDANQRTLFIAKDTSSSSLESYIYSFLCLEIKYYP